jgi:uncharacterized lipoprotein YddW (UPF0748 family)
MWQIKTGSLLFFILAYFSVFSQKHYECYRASDSIIIDGDVYNDEWKNTSWSDFFTDIEGDQKPTPKFQTRVKMLWDDSYLYIAAEMEEPHIWGYLENHDDIIYRDNDFEVFIDPLGKGVKYFEIEINALETILDLYMVKPYKKGGKADLTWNAEGLKKAVKIYGAINDTSGIDNKWTVELAIPWTSYNTRVKEVTAPKNGDVWRVNFSRVEWNSQFADGKYKPTTDSITGKKLPENNWVWSPQGIINMHVPEHWGYVTFIDSLPTVDNRIWTKSGFPKYWVWMGANSKNSPSDWEKVMRTLDDAGIKGMLYHSGSTLLNKVIYYAKQYNIKVHAWFWTMNRGDADPQWLSYNQLGQSLADKKAYVGYYKFMCPALPEVKNLIKTKIDTLLLVEDLEGIHMDYIRYVDVILPVGLQPKYKLVQDHIMPKYDYGYHPYMRDLYKEKYGIDPINLDNTSTDSSWIQFRLDQLNETVEEIRSHVSKKGFNITAAVFPTPNMSAEMVRQDWKNWNLDCYFPMVYHNFYNEDLDWITKVIKEDKMQIGNSSNIFCGLYLPSLKENNDLELAIKAAFKGGADGISFFSYGALNPGLIEQIKTFTK